MTALDVREKPSLRLSVDVQLPTGQHQRWGIDEPKAQNVPNNLGFGTTIPGGFEQCSCTLKRRPELAYSDLVPLSTLTVRGASGQVAWQGRLESSPRISGDNLAVTPGAVGWQAHLADDNSARMVYVNRDLSTFTGPGATRRLNLLAALYNITDHQVDPDPTTGAPALALINQFPVAATFTPTSEAWFDAGSGCTIAVIDYAWTQGPTVSATFLSFIQSSTNDTTAGGESSSDLATGSASGSGTFTPSTPRRFVMVNYSFTAGPAGSDGQQEAWRYTNLTMFGGHGLTIRGTAPSRGLYASDVVSHAVRTWAPLLDVSVTDTSFIIPQLVFSDPTTASEIISTANRYHLRDWAVWESASPTGRPTFYYYDRGTRGKTWRTRVSVANLEEAGPDVAHLWNGVIVRFQDVDGTTKTVGPTGSGSDTTSTQCSDPDPLNPATLAGIRRWAVIDMGGVSTAAGATEVGRRFIVETAQFNTSGRAALVGHVEDDRGVVWPAWRVRAGDTISFTDSANPEPRRIVRTNYDDASKTNAIDLDAPAEGLEALLQRLQVVLVGVI